MTGTEIFFLLAVAGVILLGIEVLIPGGIVGAVGVLCLVGAAVTSFVAFGPEVGILVSIGLIIGSVVAMMLWLRYIPHSRLGKALTLKNDLKSSKSSDEIPGLLNQTGEALTDLGPSGIARINGTRVDVITEGQFIKAGTPVTVVDLEGIRVVVRKVG